MRDEYSLDPPEGLERLERFLRERTSDGNAYGLIADVVAWSEDLLEKERKRCAAIARSCETTTPGASRIADMILMREPGR